MKTAIRFPMGMSTVNSMSTVIRKSMLMMSSTADMPSDIPAPKADCLYICVILLWKLQRMMKATSSRVK